MERSEILTAMGELKLYGMKNAFDEIIGTAVKRQHQPQRIIGDLLTAEIAEKQARSIKYQITIAKLPLAKDIDDFVFDDTPVNEALVRDLAGGDFLAHQRNIVLVGGTGTGKTHLAIAIARACIRNGARGRFFNVVDLVNKLDAEVKNLDVVDDYASELKEVQRRHGNAILQVINPGGGSRIGNARSAGNIVISTCSGIPVDGIRRTRGSSVNAHFHQAFIHTSTGDKIFFFIHLLKDVVP